MFTDSTNPAPEQLSKDESVFLEYQVFGIEIPDEERQLIRSLVDIYEETELPKFDMVETTSTSNLKIQKKAENVFTIIPEQEAIPEVMRKGYPINYDDESKLKAPWVNLVHGWSKVLNYMNTISEMQKEEVGFDPQVMAGVARALLLLTVNSDPNPFLRTDARYNEGTYAETKMREWGTKGVNARRHVNLEEMKYMLSTVRRKFAKD